jgi:hypothetical protein
MMFYRYAKEVNGKSLELMCGARETFEEMAKPGDYLCYNVQN